MYTPANNLLPQNNRPNMTRHFLVAVIFILFAFSAVGAPPSQSIPPASSSAATPVPEPPRKITEYSLSPELFKKANTLGNIHFVFRLFRFLYFVFVLWFLLGRKVSAQFRDWAESASRFRFVQAIIYAPLSVLAIALMQIPLDIFNESLSKHYGISVQSWSSWTSDWLTFQLLTVIFATFFAWILLAIVRGSPRRWWLYFWVVSVPILLFIFSLQPLLIDPLFNKFEPLSAKAPELIPQLERITVRGGMPIPPDRMFWMLASDKTIYTNAYVTGIGATKRVVIWDTAIAKETSGGILTMFGHEMGHYVLNHIWKGFAFVSGMIFVLLYLGYRTIGWVLRRKGVAWGIRGLDDWAALPALLLIIAVFGFVANVLGNAYSRYQESQADIYSLEVTHGIVSDPGGACLVSFQMYGEQVFAQPKPNLLNVLLFYDHPTVADRMHVCATYDPWSEGRSPRYVK